MSETRCQGNRKSYIDSADIMTSSSTILKGTPLRTWLSRCGLGLLAWAPALLPPAASAISVGTTEKDLSPEAEMASFTLMEGFEVNLFASEKDGVINPISIRWDEKGRLWVLSTVSYPQPQPGEVCDDKVLILEDSDKDGKADKVTVFADKLRMPMGLELAPGPSGTAYVGEAEKLWLMRDTDGDGRADVKEVVFSGFGTGDTHQNINSLTWTPDGALMFSQGLHCYSNVTTVYGGRRLYGAGFWTYRPLTGKLTPYPTGFPLNAWGTVYDDQGQPFTVAGAAGMFWTTPLLISTEHLIEGRALPNNGQIVKQGMLKYCGIDIPRNAHWPLEMQGELVSGGFFENCIYRHKLQDDAANPSGYEAVRQPDLLKSNSVSFRPVDVKFGPEGALYVSDWFNPIIGHYQASFRHPDRDKAHGRIWRIVKKDAPLAKIPAVGQMSTQELLTTLGTTGKDKDPQADRWSLYQAQRLLMGKPVDEVLKQLASLEEGEGKSRAMVATLQTFAAFETPNVELLKTLLGSSEAWCRAQAVRTIPLWQEKLTEVPALLEQAITDDMPRVRLEAIAACSEIPNAGNMAIALKALDKPMDSFLDRSLELAIHTLAPLWEPAVKGGSLKLPPRHLAYLLEKKSNPELLTSIRAMLKEGAASLDADSRRVLVILLAKQGTADDVALALEAGKSDKVLLDQLADLVESQNLKAPANALEVLTAQPEPRLIGLWKLTSLAPKLKGYVEAPDAAPETKRYALIALARLDQERDLMVRLASETNQPWQIRLGAIEALCEKEAALAAKSALPLMNDVKTEDEMRALLAPFLAKAGRLKSFVKQLDAEPCGKEPAELASRTLMAIGRNEADLTAVLNRILGRTAAAQPYDAQYVSSLANAATVAGDAKHGKEIFERPTMTCRGCHQIGGIGGIIGPQLDAVGRGVPVELLVEAVLWPQRQIKEGYTATTITTKDGRTIAGYKVAESGTDLQVRDMATQQVMTLPKASLASRADAGSLMPEGLAASLSRDELRDLIAYLASLGK